MSVGEHPLFRMLSRRCGSDASAYAEIERLEFELGAHAPDASRAMLAIALVGRGAPAETVSRHLTWREFECFCADIARAEGYSVKENLTLPRPRVQIDVVARSTSLAVAIDCKHWSRLSQGAMRSMAIAQLRRARLLRQKWKYDVPIASAILTLGDSGERFCEGVAIVPIFTLRSFLHSVDGLTDLLELQRRRRT